MVLNCTDTLTTFCSDFFKRQSTQKNVLSFCLTLWVGSREYSVQSFQLLVPFGLESTQLPVPLGLARTQSFQLLVPLRLARTQSFQLLVPLRLARTYVVISVPCIIGTEYFKMGGTRESMGPDDWYWYSDHLCKMCVFHLRLNQCH